VQTLTIDEHFKLLINDNDIINSNFVDITSNNLPNWYNEKLFKEAQNYYKRNIMLMIQASFAGLLAIIVVPETLKVLIYTQKSNMPCVTFSRYTQTLLHMYKLYTCDLNDANSDMYKTLNVIHRKHKMSSKRSENAGIGGIYQRDMAITQFAFIGYVLIAPKSIGLCIKPQEEEALNHFWRVMGHMLEIPDRLNLCRKTAAETRELCQKVANILTEYLNNAPMEFYHITSAILDGLWYFDVTLDKHAFLKFTYELHVQPLTVDEHYKLIIEDKSVIDPEATDVTSSDLPKWYNKQLYKEWYKSINTIRWHHTMSTRMTKKAGIGEIYQRDMVLTQYAFLGYVFMVPRNLGLKTTPEEDEAFNHFWRVNGYMLGITDKLNLCRKNAIETTELCFKIKDLFRTYLINESPEFYEITLNTLNAIWYTNILMDADLFMAIIYMTHDLPRKYSIFVLIRNIFVLLYTKRSNSTCSAFKRYLETILHIHNLYMCDPNDTNSKWYKSMNAIRWHHVMATRMAKKAGIEEICQRDMVLTQFAFLGYILTASRDFGLNNTLEEDEAFNHLWRVNGYMLGITDNLNICRKNAKETTELCYKIKDLYGTYLRNASPEFYEIILNMLNAMWYVIMIADIDVFLAAANKIHGLPGKYSIFALIRNIFLFR
ncbi:hypothetical protein ALC62_01427, partial [Cyphomyrmex costatus]